MYKLILLQEAREYLNALKGPDLRRPHADVSRGKIRELRCGIGRLKHRLLYFFDGRRAIVLSHGFDKQQAEVPARDLEQAKERMGRFESNPKAHTYEV